MLDTNYALVMYARRSLVFTSLQQPFKKREAFKFKVRFINILALV